MNSITLKLPDHIAADLAAVSREANRHPEELAIEMLRRALLVRRFERAQEIVAASLRTDAPKREEDAFDQIS